jgi:outer membrane immunogenic protein
MRFLVGALAFAALGIVAPASAADMPAKAPIAAPSFSWQRCYVGGHVGYGWARSDIISEAAIINATGFVGGFQGGCNWQPVKSLLLGVEGEVWWTDIRGSVSQPVQGGTETFTYRNRWDADLALRLGVPVDRALIYGKVGIAYGNFDYGWSWTVPPGATATASSSRTGWLVGIGLEYALSNNWSAKIEYNYIDYGRADITLMSPTLGPIAASTRETKQVLKLGVNYLFGGPVVAKY